jgi:hypothetical protein
MLMQVSGIRLTKYCPYFFYPLSFFQNAVKEVHAKWKTKRKYRNREEQQTGIYAHIIEDATYNDSYDVLLEVTDTGYGISFETNQYPYVKNYFFQYQSYPREK